MRNEIGEPQLEAARREVQVQLNSLQDVSARIDNGEVFLSPSSSRQILDINRNTLYAHVSRGNLRAYKIGPKLYFSLPELHDFQKTRRRQGQRINPQNNGRRKKIPDSL